MAAEKPVKELKFFLERTSGLPYYRQIIMQVEIAVAEGRIRAGAKLPTVRSLSADLRINPNTVSRAYNELKIQGIVNTRQGTGTFISDKKSDGTEEERLGILRSLIRTFVANTSSYGFVIDEVMEHLNDFREEM